MKLWRLVPLTFSYRFPEPSSVWRGCLTSEWGLWPGVSILTHGISNCVTTTLSSTNFLSAHTAYVRGHTSGEVLVRKHWADCCSCSWFRLNSFVSWRFEVTLNPVQWLSSPFIPETNDVQVKAPKPKGVKALLLSLLSFLFNLIEMLGRISQHLHPLPHRIRAWMCILN